MFLLWTKLELIIAVVVVLRHQSAISYDCSVIYSNMIHYNRRGFNSLQPSERLRMFFCEDWCIPVHSRGGYHWCYAFKYSLVTHALWLLIIRLLIFNIQLCCSCECRHSQLHVSKAVTYFACLVSINSSTTIYYSSILLFFTTLFRNCSLLWQNTLNR